MTLAQTRGMAVAALLLLAAAGSRAATTDAPAAADAAKAADGAATAAPAAPRLRATKAPAQPGATAAAQARAQLPAPSALETQYGLQVAHIGVTASNGLVDARFKVLDARKVTSLLHDPANAPTLIVGGKPPLAAPHSALHGARFQQGQVFFILYPNLRNAVAPGTEVTVGLGDARLGPVTAQ